MQLTCGYKRDIYLVDESVPPVTEKERRGEGKSSIGPKMKYGHANHKLNCPYTNGGCSVSNLLYSLEPRRVSLSEITFWGTF